MTDVIIIDSRSAGAAGESVRIMAMSMVSTGKVLISKTAPYHDPIIPKDDILVVTDTPNLHSHWSLSFNEKTNTKELINCYRQAKNSGLLQLSEQVRQYDPTDVLQAAKMDERGQVYEFDTGISCGHMAVLMAIWAAHKAYGGHVISSVAPSEPICDFDDGMMPFSVG